MILGPAKTCILELNGLVNYLLLLLFIISLHCSLYHDSYPNECGEITLRILFKKILAHLLQIFL